MATRTRSVAVATRRAVRPDLARSGSDGVFVKDKAHVCQNTIPSSPEHVAPPTASLNVHSTCGVADEWNQTGRRTVDGEMHAELAVNRASF